MAKTIKIKCSNCNYRLSLKEGLGSLDDEKMLLNIDNPQASPFNILSKLKNKEQKIKVKDMIENGAKLSGEYGYSIDRCPSCMNITSNFYFKLVNKKEVYQPTYYCKSCKQKLNKISSTTAIKSKCPKCSSKLLYIDTIYND